MNKLNSCPADSISCIRFDQSSKYLLTSSWDSHISLYNIQDDDCVQTYKSRGPVLGCDFTSSTTACSGGLDCDIKVYDLQRTTDYVIGQHQQAVSCIRWNTAKQCICSGSWDGTIALWDPLASTNGAPSAICSARKVLSSSTKIYALDVLDNTLIAATNTIQILLYDVRNMDRPLEIRDSKQKYNLRSICALPHDNGFATGSIEGRVGIDYLHLSDASQAYCFRCHRQNRDGQPVVFAINALTAHPTKPYLATGGGDQSCCVWDYKAKRRVFTQREFPTSVSALVFNSDGSMLGVATSYLYENGQKAESNPGLYIKRFSPSELP